MFKEQATEEEIFLEIERYAPVYRELMSLLVDIADLRQAILAENPDLRDGICPRFRNTIVQFVRFKKELVSCGVDHFPDGLFTQLSPALHWVMRGLRRILPKCTGPDDPIAMIVHAFDRFKETCRADTRDEGLDDVAVGERLSQYIREICNAGESVQRLMISHADEALVGRQPEGPAVRMADAACAMAASAADMQKATELLDRRDRRHHDSAGKGTAPSARSCAICARLWEEWRTHPEWVGGLKKGDRVSKKAVYEELKAQGKLPASIDCAKAFVRAIDSARKSPHPQRRE